ncbi:hypothetical protein [Rubricoccus marinus]|uniref:Homoserine dehydrogenase n=1 Tax=Rubricoccus marinus TaxID=716817 RepID=A0A259U063_9BACT|nr:hypothetical protein [Rubricoccus marinus]OZC03326.1 hypothetical protein BSZ36_10240 [Rubricoccus marinus]
MTTAPFRHPAAPVSGAPLAQPSLDVFVFGTGHVGGALLRQIAGLSRAPVRVVGAATTRGHVYRASGVTPEALAALVAESAPPDLSRLVPALVRHPRPLAVVDATGSLEVSGIYEDLLASGVSVVTPSKLACAGPQARFYRLRDLGASGPAHFGYETTVGAGLPVIRTLQTLTATGDRVRSIRAALSGTLTFLFGEVERGIALSDAVATAVARGYAEPDPRDDLSGEDIVRKALILARAARLHAERAEVRTVGLVSDAVRTASPEDLPDALRAEGQAWSERACAAAARGERVRYVATITADAGRAQIDVRPLAVPAASPFGMLGGTDNLIEITTDRYAASPLRIMGPGAGPDVTAAGVLSELLAIAA